MLRGTFLFVVAISFSCSVGAQNTYMRYYSQLGIDECNMHELSSGNMLVGFAYNSGISLIDRFGNILHTRRYLVDTFMVVQSVRKRTDNDFAFVGIYNKDTCGNEFTANPAIGRMDSLGNIINVKSYTFNGRCAAGFGGDLEITASNDAVAWGRDWGFFAMRVGPTGDVQWAKRFQHRGGFNFIKELPGGDLLAGFNTDTAGACVARLDASGNFI